MESKDLKTTILNWPYRILVKAKGECNDHIFRGLVIQFLKSYNYTKNFKAMFISYNVSKNICSLEFLFLLFQDKRYMKEKEESLIEALLITFMYENLCDFECEDFPKENQKLAKAHELLIKY